MNIIDNTLNELNRTLYSEQKFTELGKSYWNKNGIYQIEYDRLYKEFVPISGNATTLNGELIRAISRLFYEYCNNGNCNACETKTEYDEYQCPECGGFGEIEDEDEVGNITSVECSNCYGDGYISEEYEGEGKITEMYYNFLKLIRLTLKNYIDEEIQEIGDFIKGNHYTSSNQFSKENMQMYNILCDKVIYYVLTNEDKEIPDWYTN